MKPKDDADPKSNADIVDLASFRRKKTIDSEFARDRKPLYLSHFSGKATGSPHLSRTAAPDFGDRLQRIRASLQKINRLMSELKKMSHPTDDSEASKPK